MGFPGGCVVKNPPANAGDVGLIPGSEKSPGEGNGSSLRYSCLGNATDRGAWQDAVHGVMKSRTCLSNKKTTAAILQYDLILIHCICKDTLRSWGLALQHVNFEGRSLQHITDTNCVMKRWCRGESGGKGLEKQKGLACSGNQRKVNVT